MSENEMPPVPNFECQTPPPVPPAVKGSNGIAVAALVFGILGLILIPFNIVAIILGAIGISKAKKVNNGKGLATAGLILGCAPFVLWIVLVPAILLPSLNTARTLAKNAMSATNLNGIGKAMVLYDAQHEMYPDKTGRLVEQGYASVKMFTNPKSNSTAILQDGDIITDGYVIILPEKDSPRDDLMAYENEEYAYKGKIAVLTVNGGVRNITVEELHAKLAEQEAKKQLPQK